MPIEIDFAPQSADYTCKVINDKLDDVEASLFGIQGKLHVARAPGFEAAMEDLTKARETIAEIRALIKGLT